MNIYSCQESAMLNTLMITNDTYIKRNNIKQLGLRDVEQNKTWEYTKEYTKPKKIRFCFC